MLPMKEDKENKFVEVRREDTVDLFQAAIRPASKLMIWTEGQKYSFHGRIQRVNEAAGSVFLSVPKEIGGFAFESSLLQFEIEDCLFTLNLPTDVLFFKGKLKRSDESALNFKVNLPIFKIQRRRNLRLPVSGDRYSKVRIQLSASDSQPIEAEFLNVSEGGVGVLVQNAAVFARLPLGKQLAIVSFTIDGNRYDATGEVRYGEEIGSTLQKRKYKVGIQFVKIDRAQSDRLSHFVFEESAKFFGRL